MIAIWGMLLIGLFLSAFFSGCETGFYRATRFRVVLDAIDGDWIARGLMWLINNPTLFVATILVGNNLANYLASRSIVMAVHQLWGTRYMADFFAAVVSSPAVFIYAELLPKTLFYRAPNQLLRLSGPMLLISTAIFMPVSLVLWALGQVLQRLLGQAPLRIRLRLAQQELREVLHEGEQAGVLTPSQRSLADTLLTAASRPIGQVCQPLRLAPQVEESADRQLALLAAQRRQLGIVLVKRSDGREILGYYRVIELLVGNGDLPLHPLLRICDSETVLKSLTILQQHRQEVAAVEGPGGETVGLVHLRDVMRPMLRGVATGP